MVPGSESARYTTGADSHVGNVRVLPVVTLGRQEICIRQLHVSTAGFSDHRLQRSEPLYVPFECEHLIATTIEQTGSWKENIRAMG
jgi:hypothetical protein